MGRAPLVEGGGLEALIAYARQHGNTVTYDEVNTFMPADISTTAEIDGWVDRLSADGIRLVDRR